MKPIKVDDATLAFPARVSHLMPVNEPGYQKYRDDWHSRESWGSKLFNEWFYNGVKDLNLWPKEGIDPAEASRHIQSIMRSFEPSHQDKTASCVFLLEHWFEKAEWKPLPKD